MKIKFNFNKRNSFYCLYATLFYVGYCFIGYSKELFGYETIWQYWLNSALFIDGKMLVVLAILAIPYIKAFVEGTYLNNKSVMTLFK